MHKTYTKLVYRYSPSSPALAILDITTFSIAFFPIVIIGMEIFKTNTSFLTLCSCFKDTY